jgi:PLP dependent protein
MEQLSASNIRANISAIQQQIAAACVRIGRQPEDVKLIAVSKKRTVDEIRTALDAGVRFLGENRVEEAVEKQPQLGHDTSTMQWHMIGHVQSRKARDVAQHFDVVHSIDSDKLLRRLNGFAAEFGRQLDILLQVNVSGEDSKYGFDVANWENNSVQREQLWAFVENATTYTHLRLVGLMTMAPYVEDAETVRPFFASLRRLLNALRNDFEAVPWCELSMGMTNDFVVAVEEGATMVRVGRAIFGERQ